MRQGGGRFRFLPPPWIHPYLKRPKGSCPFWITRGSECLGFLALFGVLQGMLDDHEIVDRRRKKRIGVSKKFRTYVHPHEHRPPDGCVSVCRGEHRSSAAGANDNTTPMQIRNPIGYEFASACCNWGDYTADERCSPLRRNTHPVAPRSGR